MKDAFRSASNILHGLGLGHGLEHYRLGLGLGFKRILKYWSLF